MNITSLSPLTILLLVATMPLAAASLDMFLPALPEMVKEFRTTETEIHVSLTLNIIASAAMGLISGTLSDHFGRRKLFVSALFAFTAGTFLCSMASNVLFFSIARTLQGASSGVIFVMVSTILSDVYTGVKKAQVLGIATFLFPVALGIAPFFGEKVYHWFGWPATFISLSLVVLSVSVGLFFLLPETKKRSLEKLRFMPMLKDFRMILSSMAFLVHAMIPAVFMGAFMAFIAYSPFIYMGYFGLSSQVYVYFFITPLAFQFIAGVSYQLIIKLIGIDNTQVIGVIMGLLGLTVITAMLTQLLPLTPALLMVAMIFYNSAIPFVLPAAMSKAFEAFPLKAGSVSSLASLTRNTLMAVYIAIGGAVFNHTPVPILWVLVSGLSLFTLLSIVSLRQSWKTA